VYYAITHELGEDHGIVRQLYWRDFYLQAVLYIERANDWTKHIDERFSNLPWKNNVEDWKRLMDGQTGFLLVDAGIMQMKTTGFIHGRIRMILGFMWTKYLLIDSMHPHYGSQVGFSKYLVDAVGPSQNLMNHRWILDFDYPGKKYSAANAPLSGRPMDISNKMIKKWDPSCAYIKTWLPHLKDVPEKDLRRWNAVMSKKYNNIHPGPMFDAKEKYKEWVEFSTYF
jgi:deoxyribodipyrimidine photo-lyase